MKYIFLFLLVPLLVFAQWELNFDEVFSAVVRSHAVQGPVPLAWYKMDDNSATYDLIDSSGNNYTASFNANTDSHVTQGLVNGGLWFASEGSYLYPPETVRSVIGSAFTLSIWVKLDIVSAPFVALFASDGSGTYNAYCWVYLPSRQINMGIGGDNYQVNQYPMHVEGWNCFTLVNDLSTFTLYLNGSVALSVPITGYDSGALCFLRAWDGNYNPVAADELKVFNTALSESQVKSLFEKYGVPPPPPPSNIIVTFDCGGMGYSDYNSYEYAPGSRFSDSVFPNAYPYYPESNFWSGYWVDYNTYTFYSRDSVVPSENVTLYAYWY